MTLVDEQEQHLEQVLADYLEAVEAGTEPDRTTWLNSHPDLAQTLADFLASSDEVDRFARPLRRPPLVSPRLPRSFGDYLLLEEIGRGGMGVVYKARQASPERLVALKVIHPGRLLGATDARRFRNEAEAVASLDHPNIVPIYEVCERESTLYFTMKWIERGNLAAWCRGTPQTPHDAARLIAAVSRAVHHAHQRGVLHRDLKPSNILLDASGQPYVADFGLAKQLQATDELTQTGALLGTPAYMAPEQAAPTLYFSSAGGRKLARQATTATDVYGLGATLYALLAGRPPFQGHGALDTLAQIMEHEPPPPSRFNPRVDRDLEAVCLKCLEKEPGRRYGSAEALAEDLERWVGGKPVQARIVGRLGRTWRWCRRNPALASVLGLLFVTLSVGLTAAIWGTSRYTADLRNATKVAESHREAAERQRGLALDNLRAVITEIKDLENRRPELDDLRQDLLLRVQKYLIPILQDPDHELRADETNFWLEIDIGDVFRDQENQVFLARDHYGHALTIADGIGTIPDQERQYRRLRSYALSRLGDTLLLEGKYADAWERVQEMQSLREKLLTDSADCMSRADLAVANLKSGDCCIWLFEANVPGDWIDKAMQYFGMCHALYQALEKEFPDQIEYARMFGHACDRLADVAHRRLQWAKVIECCQAAVRSRRCARARFPGCELAFDIDNTYSFDRMAVAYMLQAQFEHMRPVVEEATEILTDLSKRNPRSVWFKRRLGLAYDRQGIMFQGLGQYELAQASYRRIYTLQKEFVIRPSNSPVVYREHLDTLDRLIVMNYLLDQKDDETQRNALESLAWRRKIVKENPTNQFDALCLFGELRSLGDYHMLHNRPAEAKKWYAECFEFGTSSSHIQPRSDDLALVRRRIAAVSRATEPGFDAAVELVDLAPAWPFMLRLQREFETRKDATRLAKVSDRQPTNDEDFKMMYASARGFAKAAILAKSGKERQTYEQRSKEMLARLDKFGGEVSIRIRQDPAFAELLPPSKTNGASRQP